MPGNAYNEQYLASIAKAEKRYDVIRQTDDIATISRNTGLPEHRIARIKDHLFFRPHQLDQGVRRFHADELIADAWERLQRGDFESGDIDLLHHELFESRFEGIFKTDYRTAHDAANRSGRYSGIEGKE